jgi:hypothetical protein
MNFHEKHIASRVFLDVNINVLIRSNLLGKTENRI